MITGHTQPPELLQTAIYGMHMPLFFYISGLLWRGEVHLAHSARALWRPFVAASLLSWLLWVAKQGVHGSDVVPWWGPLLVTIWGGNLHGWFVHNTPLWFLPAMLSMLVVLWLAGRMSPKFAPVVLAMIGLGVLWTAAKWPLSHGPMSLAQGLVGGVFFAAGHWSKNRMTLQRPVVGSLALSLSVIVALINGRVDLFSMQFQEPLLYLSAGLLGAWGLVVICTSPHVQFSLLQQVGRRSLLVLAVQMPLLWVLRGVLRIGGLPEHWWLLTAWCMCLVTALAYWRDRRDTARLPL